MQGDGLYPSKNRGIERTERRRQPIKADKKCWPTALLCACSKWLLLFLSTTNEVESTYQISFVLLLYHQHANHVNRAHFWNYWHVVHPPLNHFNLQSVNGSVTVWNPRRNQNPVKEEMDLDPVPGSRIKHEIGFKSVSCIWNQNC